MSVLDDLGDLGSLEWLWILVRVGLTILITVTLVHLNQWAYGKSHGRFLFKKFLYNILTVAIYAIGILTALSYIPGLNSLVSTLLAGSGIMALAISLSAQESLNNIISGLFISIFKPFDVGDRITLVDSSLTGFIEDITLRHTVIRTLTNTRIVVPNAVMNDKIVENSNMVESKVCKYLDIYVAYDCDIDKAMSLFAEIVGRHPLFLDTRTDPSAPKVTVLLREMGESSLNLRASVWTRTVAESFTCCSDIRVAVLKEFRAAGIEIPYNKMDVYIKEVPESMTSILPETGQEEVRVVLKATKADPLLDERADLPPDELLDEEADLSSDDDLT